MVRYDERRGGWGEGSVQSRCRWLLLREYLDKLRFGDRRGKFCGFVVQQEGAYGSLSDSGSPELDCTRKRIFRFASAGREFANRLVQFGTI